MRKTKKLKERGNKQNELDRKESELQCFKRIQVSDLHLTRCIHPEVLQKILSNADSTEHERAISRILLNPIIQKTMTRLKNQFGEESVAGFLKDNEKNITTNIVQKTYLKKEEESRPEEVTTSTDSFFVTQTGTNYAVSREPSEASDEPKLKKKKKMLPKLKKPQKLVKTKVSPSRPVERKHEDKFVEKPREKMLAKAKVAPKIVEKAPQSITDDADVHPSWKAKAQMRKKQILGFEGTKIKFDDDD